MDNLKIKTNASQTKQFRKDLDGVLQKLKYATGEDRDSGRSEVRSSRERTLSITKIQEAIMWLGMDLKAMREEGELGFDGPPANPYPESYNPDSQVIEPTADGLKL